MIAKKNFILNNIEKYQSYLSPRGTFFWFNNQSGLINYSHQCREVATNYKGIGKHIGFAVQGLNIDKFNELWESIENQLNIKKKTIIHRTSHPNFIVLELSPFWTQNFFRKELTTLFMRACTFNGKTFKQCINYYSLAKRIKPVIHHILDGFVYTKGITDSTFRANLVNVFTQYNYSGSCRKDFADFLSKEKV